MFETAHPCSDRYTVRGGSKLTGCLIRGEGDGAGFMLINSPFEPSFDAAKTSHIEPNAVGTSGNYADTFYWLDGDRGLGKNVGHQVEVVGYLRNIKQTSS